MFKFVFISEFPFNHPSFYTYSMLKALLYGKTPQIVRCGHPVLRHVCEPVSDFKNQQLHAVVAEMKAVFANKLTPVVGLAAPQVIHLFL